MIRRFRLVVGSAILAALLLTLLLGAGFTPEEESRSAQVSYGRIIVQPGDTLWAIAKSVAPQKDPREIVWVIRQQNDLDQAVVYPGQALKVPIYKAASL